MGVSAHRMGVGANTLIRGHTVRSGRGGEVVWDNGRVM